MATFILAEVDLDSYVYWKDGYFYFDNVTLKDIMQNLGRWYNVNIEFRNKEAMTYKMHFISDRTKDLEHTISLLNRMKKSHCHLARQYAYHRLGFYCISITNLCNKQQNITFIKK